jgi:hypothetical protein
MTSAYHVHHLRRFPDGDGVLLPHSRDEGDHCEQSEDGSIGLR